MRRIAAVAVILSIPALLTADINRFNPDRDLERPDALPRSVQRPDPGLTAMSIPLPVWEGVGKSIDAGRRPSQLPCPPSVPPYLTRCRPQPDCSGHANAPALWPHTPRVDERKTSDRERLLLKGRVQDSQPAN
jgi:hypothetical protein